MQAARNTHDRFVRSQLSRSLWKTLGGRSSAGVNRKIAPFVDVMIGMKKIFGGARIEVPGTG